MNIIVLIIIVIVCVALLMPAVDYLIPNQPYGRIVKALIIIAGVLIILTQSGLLPG
jgi:hypothetical protein